jgi:transposase-like protein
MLRSHGGLVPVVSSSAFKGFRFPPEIIVLAVRWYLRYGLSYRDVEELLTERGIEVDHVTVYRWVQRFTPLLADAARPCRHAVGDRWFVDETFVKVAGRWRYVYRAIDQYGQIIDVYVSDRRDIRAARWFFMTALGAHDEPTEVVTDRAWTLRAVIDELIPGAFHNTEQYANNRIETDHGRLKARLRPMRGLKRDHRTRDHPRSRADAEHSARPLPTRHRSARPSACRGRVHRTCPHHLKRTQTAGAVSRGHDRPNATEPSSAAGRSLNTGTSERPFPDPTTRLEPTTRHVTGTTQRAQTPPTTSPLTQTRFGKGVLRHQPEPHGTTPSGAP